MNAIDFLTNNVTGRRPCIRVLQTFHELLDREKGFGLDMLRNIALLVEEIGEVVKAIREFNNANDASTLEDAKDHLGEELADCLAFILKLANYGGVDLQAAYERKMMQNCTRAWHLAPLGEKIDEG